MKKCSKCGALMEEEANFCPDCGTPVSEEIKVVDPPLKGEETPKSIRVLSIVLPAIGIFLSISNGAFGIAGGAVSLAINKEKKHRALAIVSIIVGALFLALTIGLTIAEYIKTGQIITK